MMGKTPSTPEANRIVVVKAVKDVTVALARTEAWADHPAAMTVAKQRAELEPELSRPAFIRQTPKKPRDVS